MIETARLFLRPLQAADTDDLLHVFADPRVMASFGVAPFERGQMEEWVQEHLHHQVEFGFGTFAVILKANGMLIGDCALEQMDIEGDKAVELGYDFRSDYWHQGLATEAASALRDWAFGTLRLPRLISIIRIGNRASQRVAERLGMQCVGEFTRYGSRYWKYALDSSHESDRSEKSLDLNPVKREG